MNMFKIYTCFVLFHERVSISVYVEFIPLKYITIHLSFMPILYIPAYPGT
jgi:hypothetical protein